MAAPEEKKDSGLSLQTLLISAVAAVVATVVVSQFWERGTLLFTAMVPVMVALISEALKRPAEKVAAVAPIITSSRRSPGPTGTAVHDPAEPGVPEEARRALPADDPFGLYEPARRRVDSGRWIRVGLVTGIVAFLVGATVVTASELALFGGSIGGGSGRTTYFGGSTDSRSDAERRDTTTGEQPPGERPPDSNRPDTPDPAPTATPAPPGEATPPPAQTPGATPTPEATPTPGPAPGATPPPGGTPPPAP